MRVLSGRFVEHDRAFAHQGFCELIQDYFRSKDTGLSEASRPDFTDLAADLLALFPVLSEIGELRAAASSDSGAVKAGGERKAEDKIAIFELIARTLTRLAGGKPLLLALEELHGAQLSIEALQYVARRLGPTPTLIVGTYRQTEVDKRHPLAKMLESFRGDPRFAALTLGPLTPSEHRALVELAAGGGKLSDDLAGRLLAATEGNPLFTKELRPLAPRLRRNRARRLGSPEPLRRDRHLLGRSARDDPAGRRGAGRAAAGRGARRPAPSHPSSARASTSRTSRRSRRTRRASTRRSTAS